MTDTANPAAVYATGAHRVLRDLYDKGEQVLPDALAADEDTGDDLDTALSRLLAAAEAMEQVADLSTGSGWHEPKVGIAAFVRRPDGRFLLGHRTGPHGRGTWGLVGGHLDGGETWTECAARECQEETGIALPPTAFRSLPGAVTNDLFSETGKHYVTVFLAATVPDGTEPQVAEPDKFAEWRWVSWDEAKTLPLMVGLVNLAAQGFALPSP
jgi:8-oxo-dGTP diphosphatase